MKHIELELFMIRSFLLIASLVTLDSCRSNSDPVSVGKDIGAMESDHVILIYNESQRDQRVCIDRCNLQDFDNITAQIENGQITQQEGLKRIHSICKPYGSIAHDVFDQSASANFKNATIDDSKIYKVKNSNSSYLKLKSSIKIGTGCELPNDDDVVAVGDDDSIKPVEPSSNGFVRDPQSDNGPYQGSASNGLCDYQEDCVYVDHRTGLFWARQRWSATLPNYNDAVGYCDTLTYGGYSDWRVPNETELRSAIDSGLAKIDQLVFFDGKNFFWTTTVDSAISSAVAYYKQIMPFDGESRSEPANDFANVLCTRSKSKPSK